MIDLRLPTTLLAGRPLAVLLGLCLAGCAQDRTGTLPVATEPAPAERSASQADRRDHAALVAAFGGEYDDPALRDLVAGTVARLVTKTDAAGPAYAVTLLDTAKVNAFALPSGRIYVTRGLLALASDGSELAAVLAHEIAHVVRRHAVQRGELEARSALVSRVAVEVLGDPARGSAIRGRSAAALATFSRAQELEADAVGIGMLAAAGYDPAAAARLLRGLGRAALLARREGPAEAAASHPPTPDRISAAVALAARSGAEGATRDRERYLAAIEGLPFGERPADGVVRGRTFLHPRLGVAFTAPAGVALENTSRAVLGASQDGRWRLMFDAVEAPEGQSLAELLATTWAEPIQEGSARTTLVNGRPVAVAASRGREWSFRLSAIRIGPTIFRLILAGRGDAPGLEREHEAALATIREIGAAEAVVLKPQRVALVAAAPGEDAAALAGHMATERPLEQFLILNGLERGEALKAGQRYKIVTERTP